MMVIKAISGLIVVCASFAVRLFRAVSGVVTMHRPGRRRFVDGPEEFVDGATYEFLHDGGSTRIRTFFKNAFRAEAHGTDSFTLESLPGPDYSGVLRHVPGLRSFQKHLPSGELCGSGVGAWHSAQTFFGKSRTVRIGRIR